MLCVRSYLEGLAYDLNGEAHTALPPEAPTVTIDLSLAPEEHFKPAVRAVLDKHPYGKSFEPFFHQMNTTLFGALELDDSDYQKLFRAASTYFPVQLRELQGISAELASSGHYVSVHYLLGLMYAAELEALLYPELSSDSKGAWCTAAMVADTCGTVVHGRNMDFPLARGADAALMTLNLDVINVPHNGIPNYKAAGIAWVTASLITVEVPRKLSIQLNARYYPTYRTHPTKQELFDYILEGRVPIMQFFRDMIEHHGVFDFEGAIDFTSNKPLSCPIYFAMVGARSSFEAAIITRDEDGLAVFANGTRTKPLLLGKQGGKSIGNEWYLVQTNYDFWEEDPADDPRRTNAEKCIQRHGKLAGVAATTRVVRDCILEDGVTNSETVYSTIMNPTSSQITTYMRSDASLIDGANGS